MNKYWKTLCMLALFLLTASVFASDSSSSSSSYWYWRTQGKIGKVKDLTTVRKDVVCVVALTLWSEAVGEGYKGLQGVASVMHKGAWGRNPSWKKALLQECFKRERYSCWRNGRYLAPRLDERSPKWHHCVEIAKDLVEGNFSPIIDADLYMNPRIVKGGWPHDWNRSRVLFVASIGNHDYYREIL